MALNIWELINTQIAALRKRNRLFTRTVSTGTSPVTRTVSTGTSPVTTYVEVEGPVTLASFVTSDANGVFLLDYTLFNFLEVIDVQLTPVSATKAPADAVKASLVGTPTLRSLTLQTYKPVNIVLGGVAWAAAGGIKVYVSVRGRIAPS